MSRFSRFDLILIVSGIVIILLAVQQSWMRCNGYGDLPSGLWTCATAFFAGETVSFSLYQMVKEVNGAKASKAFLAKHTSIKELEDEDAAKIDKP